jgi:hypothetical protein
MPIRPKTKNVKTKPNKKRAGKLSLTPLQFDEAVSALLKVKPMPKEKKKGNTGA